ncbi:PspC domain-containing protein [Thermococcus stetteri]|uniref:PspC domain-containing protein n=1 Tax=Thermococcus stetteri TaxID=49900 RepID=UPI001AE20967|nr:PspC domain-containing protein [Thermococcus stetteri]MBP1911035.1 phage shock protein PspC (stress-responsive transcriptional regulator) [Thermococcus stetteri]
MEKRLVRSKKNRLFLGVLGGIAEYLEVDPTVVRLIFVLLFAVNPGVMTLAYLLAALVMPEEGPGEEKTDLGKKLEDVINEAGESLDAVIREDRTSRIVALALILFGAVLLLDSAFRLLPIVEFRTVLAVFLLVIGVILLKESD